jgi:hypothetical protein
MGFELKDLPEIMHLFDFEEKHEGHRVSGACIESWATSNKDSHMIVEGSEKYYHERVVEQLKAENERLKADNELLQEEANELRNCAIWWSERARHLKGKLNK